MDLSDISQGAVKRQLLLLGFKDVDDKIINKYVDTLRDYHVSNPPPNSPLIESSSKTSPETQPSFPPSQQQASSDEDNVNVLQSITNHKNVQISPIHIDTVTVSQHGFDKKDNDNDNDSDSKQKSRAYRFFFGPYDQTANVSDVENNDRGDAEAMMMNKLIQKQQEIKAELDDLSPVSYPNQIETVSNMIKNGTYGAFMRRNKHHYKFRMDDNGDNEDKENRKPAHKFSNNHHHHHHRHCNNKVDQIGKNENTKLESNIHRKRQQQQQQQQQPPQPLQPRKSSNYNKFRNNHNNQTFKKKNKLKKSDPVSLFQQFEHSWKKDKFLNKKTTKLSQRSHALSRKCY